MEIEHKGYSPKCCGFINGCTALSSADGRIQSYQPWVSAEPHTAVSAVREGSSGDILALVTASLFHKGPLVPVHMTVNTDVFVRQA